MIWGKHLSIDATDCDPWTIRDPMVIREFVRQLVEAIDMVAYGEPQIIRFGHDDKEGITLLQLIETSNIACHFVESTNSFCFDLFSCKDFDVDIVKGTLERLFGKFNSVTGQYYLTYLNVRSVERHV